MEMIEICETGVPEQILAERRLWMAVIVHAVQDWLSESARVRSAADKFLFEEDCDFCQVCACAGLDPASLRSRLLRTGRRGRVHSEPRPIAARLARFFTRRKR
jgi:hypothetical protein